MENVKNIKPNYIYADAEEKFVKSVVLYYNEEADKDADFFTLYYDAECTQPVKAEELKNLFFKTQLLIDDCGGVLEDKDKMYIITFNMVAEEGRPTMVFTPEGEYTSDPHEFDEVEETAEETTEEVSE